IAVSSAVEPVERLPQTALRMMPTQLLCSPHYYLEDVAGGEAIRSSSWSIVACLHRCLLPEYSVEDSPRGDNRRRVLIGIRRQNRQLEGCQKYYPALRSASGGSSQISAPAPSLTLSRSIRARPPFLS